jgi:hypothetical protein
MSSEFVIPQVTLQLFISPSYSSWRISSLRLKTRLGYADLCRRQVHTNAVIDAGEIDRGVVNLPNQSYCLPLTAWGILGVPRSTLNTAAAPVPSYREGTGLGLVG